MAFSSGWASGVNSYLVVLVLGLVGRVSGTEEIPEVLDAHRRARRRRRDVRLGVRRRQDPLRRLDLGRDLDGDPAHSRSGGRRTARRRRRHAGPGDLRRRRWRFGARVAPGQGRHPTGDQHLARAGDEQHRQRHRGRHGARGRRCSRSTTRGSRSASPRRCSSSGWSCCSSRSSWSVGAGDAGRAVHQPRSRPPPTGHGLPLCSRPWHGWW